MIRFLRFRGEGNADLQPSSRVVLRAVEPADATLAERLHLSLGASVIHLVRLRAWEGETRLAEDIYLPADRFGPLLKCDTEAIGPLLYPSYERLCGQLVCSIAEEISVKTASAADEGTLDLPPASLVVLIERTARDALGDSIEWRRSRADVRRFRYRLALG